MKKTEFRNLLKEIRSEIRINKIFLEKALNEEFSKGNSINLQKILNILDDYEKFENEEIAEENKKIAVCYSGNPQITLTYILDSIIYNNNITLCIKEHAVFNDILVDLIKAAFVNNQIKNNWIDYKSNYNEIYLKEKSKYFDKLVYVGDYFEYIRFKNLVKKEVEYNSFGSIKLFIDKSKFKNDYKSIMNYATKEDIFVEVYEDIQEFINESKDENFSVVFGDVEILNKAKREVRGEMLFNAFPYDNYKFSINR